MSTGRALCQLLAMALAAVAPLAQAAAQASGREPVAAPAGPACELHVWGGGYPNRTPSARLMARVDPAQLDLSNPLSSRSLFSTVNRAAALSDAGLRALMPQAGSVTIVRHDAMLDFDQVPLKRIGAPLGHAATGCYGDLVIANLYALFPSAGGPYESFGLVGDTVVALLAGGDRLVIDFWYQEYRDGGARPLVFRHKNDTRLPHVMPNSADMKAALAVSADANLGTFADYVRAHRKN